MIYANHMEAEDLGATIAQFVAMLLAHPGLTIPELTIVPTGGMMTGDAQQLIDSMQADLG